MGRQYLEELQDHGRDTTKMARPISTTQLFREFLYFDEHPLGFRIHLVVRGSEDVIDPSRCAERGIILQQPRIKIVFASLIELNWIDKDTGDDDCTAPPC